MSDNDVIRKTAYRYSATSNTASYSVEYLQVHPLKAERREVWLFLFDCAAVLFWVLKRNLSWQILYLFTVRLVLDFLFILLDKSNDVWIGSLGKTQSDASEETCLLKRYRVGWIEQNNFDAMNILYGGITCGNVCIKFWRVINCISREYPVEWNQQPKFEFVCWLILKFHINPQTNSPLFQYYLFKARHESARSSGIYKLFPVKSQTGFDSFIFSSFLYIYVSTQKKSPLNTLVHPNHHNRLSEVSSSSIFSDTDPFLTSTNSTRVNQLV